MLLSMSSTIGIAVDVAIVALIVILAFIGLHKGFFKSVLSMISTVVVIVVSVIFASPLAKIINRIYDFTGLMAKGLCKSIAGMGTFYSQPIPEGVSGVDVVNSIPSSTNGFLKKLMSYVLKPLSANEIQGETVANIVSGAFAAVIMAIITGVLLFIAIKIVLSLASRLFDNITRNRVMGTINKLLGFAFGAVKGLLIAVIFATVLTLLTVIPFVNTKLSPIIQDNTRIAKPIYNYMDSVVEKYVVDGKIVQKWVDNLWKNKYKDKEDKPADNTPNGSLERPYTIVLTESEGVYTADITITFSDENVVRYYKLNPNVLSSDTFQLSVNIDTTVYKVYSIDDINTQITDLTQLDKTKSYIIKFSRVETQTSVQATIALTTN